MDSREMLGENLRNLEYAKGSRHFEDEILRNNVDERAAHRNKVSGDGISGVFNGGINDGLTPTMSETVSKLMSELERESSGG